MSSRSPDPQIGDAFGAALLDAYDGGEGWHVVERDDGFVDPMAAQIYFDEPSDWGSLDLRALQLVSGRVLDVGAGAGRHSLEMQQRGLDATALDVSAGAVEVCAARGIERTFHGTVYALAATQPEPFDAIVMLGNNVSLLGSEVASWRMFETFRRLLRPGGVVVGTLVDASLTVDPLHLAYHRRNLDRRRMPGQVTIRVRYRRLATEWFDYLLMAPSELEELASRSGWNLVDASDPDPTYLAVLRPNERAGAGPA